MTDGQLLEHLEAICSSLSIEVRCQHGDFQGGLCRFGGRTVLVLPSGASEMRKAEILCRELGRLDLSGVYVLPGVREKIDEFAVRSAPNDRRPGSASPLCGAGEPPRDASRSNPRCKPVASPRGMNE